MHDHGAGEQPVAVVQWWGIWRSSRGSTRGKTPPSKCGSDEAGQVADNEPTQRAKPPVETGHVADMSPGERQPSNQNNPRVQRISCKGSARLFPREQKRRNVSTKRAPKSVPTITLAPIVDHQSGWTSVNARDASRELAN